MTDVDRFMEHNKLVKNLLNPEERHDYYLWSVNQSLQQLLRELKAKEK